MFKTIIGTVVAGTLLMTVAAYAERDRRNDDAAGTPVISREAMTRKINDLGYDVGHLEAERGHYEAHIIERKSGSTVKARFDGKDGELIRAKSDR